MALPRLCFNPVGNSSAISEVEIICKMVAPPASHEGIDEGGTDETRDINITYTE